MHILISIGFEDLTKDIIIKMSFENISELESKDLLIFLEICLLKNMKLNFHFFFSLGQPEFDWGEEETLKAERHGREKGHVENAVECWQSTEH